MSITANSAGTETIDLKNGKEMKKTIECPFCHEQVNRHRKYEHYQECDAGEDAREPATRNQQNTIDKVFEAETGRKAPPQKRFQSGSLSSR